MEKIKKEAFSQRVLLRVGRPASAGPSHLQEGSHNFKGGKMDLYFFGFPFLNSRCSVVGIATGYGLDNGGFGVRVPARSPDGLWGPPNPYSMCTTGKSAGA
jgi:hypothetical protein